MNLWELSQILRTTKTGISAQIQEMGDHYHMYEEAI
jgi:hypothetical protein